MYIEKYNIFIVDSQGNLYKKIKIDENTVYDAHKKAMDTFNSATHDILKITNYEGRLVYTQKTGFSE